MSTHTLLSLTAFTRWKKRSSPDWQLDDFREHCHDLGVTAAHRPLIDWLRDFRALTQADASLFDADGGGSFVLR